MPRIRHIFVSPGHNYFGHHGGPAGEHPIEEKDAVQCLAGRGLEGDRFLDHKQDYKGQLTIFSWETFEQMRRELGKPDLDPALLRRNVLVEGLDLASLIGVRFELQGLPLEGVEECRPCYWMDQAVRDGTEQWMKGRGGLRCRILADGVLRRDPVEA